MSDTAVSGFACLASDADDLRPPQLADGLLDTFLAGDEGEVIGGFAGPFTLLVIADLLGVPEEDRDQLADELQHRPRSEAPSGRRGSCALPTSAPP